MDRRDFLIGTGMFALADSAAAEPVLMAQAGAPAPPAVAARPGIEEQLADYALGPRYADLPREIVDGVKRLLIDTLACAFGAVDSPPARIAEETFRKTFGGSEVASVIGGKRMMSTEGATLINGILVRYLDLNDIYVGFDPNHPSECIPAALAVAEETGASGRALIEAILVGYEAQLALADAFSFSDRGFHSLSAGGWAVPLMAGKLWGLTRAQIIDAMGVAGPRQLTLLAMNRGPISMIKAMAYANTAMDALLATRMAAAGFTGASQSIAWFAANVKGKRPDQPFSIERGKFRLPKVGLKRFPLQFELQSVAEAGVNLHERVRGRLKDIAEILVETYPSTIERTADPSRYRPATKETADHSLPVCMALALTDGDVTIEQFEHDRWKADEILALAQKVKVRVSEKLVAAEPRGRGAATTVTFGDGKKEETTVAIADGDARRPMSRAALEHKFTQHAEHHLGAARARAALAMIDRLEEIGDTRELMKALRG